MKIERDFNIECSSENEYGQSNRRWCLRQIQSDGTKEGRDLVPSTYFHRFEASNVVHTISYEDGHAKITPAKLETQEAIYAELVPKRLSSRTYLNAPCYYMVGYRDAVEQISLEIHRSENDDHCTVSSFEKTGSDIGFDAQSHSLYFSVKLSAEKFDTVSRLIRFNRLEYLALLISFADGFYSEHTHGCNDSIDSIYILSDSALKDLNLEEYAEHLPVTGKVGGFTINASSRSDIKLRKENDRNQLGNDSEKDHDPNNDRFVAIESQIERAISFLSRAADTMANLDSLLKRLRLPLWFGVVLLLMIFIQNL